MTSISFDVDLDVTYGRCDQVGDGLRRVVANNPSRFTFRGTGTYIMGTEALAVVDPGPDLPAHLEAILDAVGDNSVSHILVTHTHRDHSPLARELASATGAVIYGFGPHGEVGERDPDDWIDFGVPEDNASEPDDSDHDDMSQSEHLDGGYDADFIPDVAVKDGDVIIGDGWTIDCVHTPGHTSNHMCYGWREQRALFSGDHVMGWSTSVIAPPDGSMATYLESLELLLGRDDGVYWPTHGSPIRDPHDYVRSFINHRRDRENAIVDHIGAGLTSIEALVREMYQHVSPKLYSAASHSVHAHLIFLVADGRVQASTEAVRLTDLYSLT